MNVDEARNKGVPRGGTGAAGRGREMALRYGGCFGRRMKCWADDGERMAWALSGVTGPMRGGTDMMCDRRDARRICCTSNEIDEQYNAQSMRCAIDEMREQLDTRTIRSMIIVAL